GIPYVVDGPDGPLYADFHALRHTYLTLGGRAGIDLRTLQELAGHSTPTLTARYSHRRLYDLAGAVGKLPSFLPGDSPEGEAGALRATGTDGASCLASCLASQGRFSESRVDSGGRSRGGSGSGVLAAKPPENPEEIAGFQGEKGSGGRGIRTPEG